LRSEQRSRGSGRFEVVLADRTRLQRSEGHHTLRPQAPLPPETTVFGETAANDGSAHQPQKARPPARGARHEGSEAGSRPSPRPKTPRTRVRCPEGPSIKGPHRIGQSMFPGRPGSRVDRRKPWLRRQAQPRPTLSTQRRTSNDPLGARVRGSVADVDKTHLPPGARPAERQAANLGVTFCGGLLGDDEGPIRSGRQGCEARAGEQTSERARACLHRKVRDRINGRRPGSNRVIALTRRWLGSSLARWDRDHGIVRRGFGQDGESVPSRAGVGVRSAVFPHHRATEDVRGPTVR